jgi:hypothetical protein
MAEENPMKHIRTKALLVSVAMIEFGVFICPVVFVANMEL